MSRADQAPIFIIGTGRSGTTLLRQMLNAHPNIYLTQEAFFYFSEGLTPAWRSASDWLENYFNTFSFAWLKLSPEEVRAELPDDLPRTKVKEAFQAIMRTKARQYGKERYGDKSPINTGFLWRIRFQYPEAKIIHIVRDPRATVHSLSRMPFMSGSLLHNAISLNLVFWTMRRHLDHIHEIRLEDLIADPERILRGVLDYIDEPWDEAVLDHTNQAPTDDIPPFPWFQGATKKARKKEGPPAWRKELSSTWCRIIERHNRFCMRRYGYQPIHLDEEPTPIDRARAIFDDLPKSVTYSWRWMKYLTRFAFQKFDSPQAEMDAFLNLNPEAWANYPDFEHPKTPPID